MSTEAITASSRKAAPGGNGHTEAAPEPTRGEQKWLGERMRTVCLIVLAVCVAGAALKALHWVLAPLLIALFLYYLLMPLTDTLRRWRVPRWLSGSMLSLLLLAVLVGMGQLIYVYAASIRQRLPEYEDKLASRFNEIMVATGFQVPDDGQALDREKLHAFLDSAWRDNMPAIFGSLLGFAEVSLMMLFYLLFLFFEERTLPGRVDEAFNPETADTTKHLGRNINRRIKRYLLYKTYINVGLGATTALICALAGIEFWPVWGLGMFLLNYVTYIGSIIALIPPIALAFVQFSNPLAAGIVGLVLTANRILWIDYIEIVALGSVLNLSPLLMLLSIAFFGFIWGAVGLLLAVPLMTTIKIILEEFDETRHLGVLMSEET